MLEVFFKFILLSILIPITLLHIYWLCGGEKWLNEALPTDLEMTKKKLKAYQFQVVRIISLSPVIVGLIFLQLNIINSLPIPTQNSININLFFAVIFLIRGLLGFTVINWIVKKELFKYYNKIIYSPISLLLAILLFLI